MRVTLNGEPREIAGPCLLPVLIREVGLPEKGVLVEHNGLALRPAEWPERTVAEGDTLEIIRIVAGG